MCPDARILTEILKSERANGWMGQTWFTSNSLEPFIIFGFFSESNAFVDAFSHKFFQWSKVNKPKQSMRILPHKSLSCPIDNRVFFLVTISCSKSTYNWQTCRVIGLSSPSRLSPLFSGQDDPETAQWHVSLYIKKGFCQRWFSPRSVLTRQAV